jgi:hypothetical protein
MNHSITLGDLLLGLLAIGGFGAVGFGLLMVFAGGMSDAQEVGAEAGRQGCRVALFGIVALVAATWLLFK